MNMTHTIYSSKWWQVFHIVDATAQRSLSFTVMYRNQRSCNEKHSSDFDTLHYNTGKHVILYRISEL